MMSHRLTKMAGLPPEEKALLVRIGDLVDATINNRGPTNPFENQSAVRRDPRLPSIRNPFTDAGVRSVAIRWDPVDSSILHYYKLQITNQDTGQTQEFISFTNDYIFKGSSGEYKARISSVGRNGTAAPPVELEFTVPGDVMFLDGFCNGVTTSTGTNTASVDVFVPANYFVHVWVSFTYRTFANPNSNLSPLLLLKQTSNLSLDIDNTPILDFVQVFPESITATNANEVDSPSLTILRPVTNISRTSEDHYMSTKSLLFNAFQVRTEDEGKVNRLTVEALNRFNDIDNLCITVWVASSGLIDFESESVIVNDFVEPVELFTDTETAGTTFPILPTETEYADLITTQNNYFLLGYANFNGIGQVGINDQRYRVNFREDPNSTSGDNAGARTDLLPGAAFGATGNPWNTSLVFIRAPEIIDPINLPPVGFNIVISQDPGATTGGEMNISEMLAFSEEALGIAGVDYFNIRITAEQFASGNDANSTVSTNIDVQKEDDYLLLWQVETRCNQNDLLSLRWKFLIDDIDIYNVSTDSTSIGATNTGRGFQTQVNDIGNFWAHTGCAMVNLTEGVHNIKFVKNIFENVVINSNTQSRNVRLILIRKGMFRRFAFKEVDTTVSTSSTGATDTDFEVSLSSDRNVLVLFFTSVHHIGAGNKTTSFDLLQNDMATPIADVGAGPLVNSYTGTSGSTDADTFPFFFFKTFNNPGDSTWKVQINRVGGSGDVLANVKDDGTSGFKGYLIAAELNFAA